MTNPFSVFTDIGSALLAWLGVAIKQSADAYCDIQTADSPTVMVASDGSLLSVLRIDGVQALIGPEEFERIQLSLQQSLQTVMSQPGHVIQVSFSYNKNEVREQIADILHPAEETAKRLRLSLRDLFDERVNLSLIHI